MYRRDGVNAVSSCVRARVCVMPVSSPAKTFSAASPSFGFYRHRRPAAIQWIENGERKKNDHRTQVPLLYICNNIYLRTSYLYITRSRFRRDSPRVPDWGDVAILYHFSHVYDYYLYYRVNIIIIITLYVFSRMVRDNDKNVMMIV